MYASALSFKCTMCFAFLMCQYLCANDGRKSTALLTPLLQENRKIVLVAHFGFIVMLYILVVYSLPMFPSW